MLSPSVFRLHSLGSFMFSSWIICAPVWLWLVFSLSSCCCCASWLSLFEWVRLKESLLSLTNILPNLCRSRRTFELFVRLPPSLNLLYRISFLDSALTANSHVRNHLPRFNLHSSQISLAATRRLSLQGAWYESMTFFRVSSTVCPGIVNMADAKFSLEPIDRAMEWLAAHNRSMGTPYNIFDSMPPFSVHLCPGASLLQFYPWEVLWSLWNAAIRPQSNRNSYM